MKVELQYKLLPVSSPQTVNRYGRGVPEGKLLCVCKRRERTG